MGRRLAAGLTLLFLDFSAPIHAELAASDVITAGDTFTRLQH